MKAANTGGTSGWGIAVEDSSGSAYLTGVTVDPTFPTTPGAYRTSTPSCSIANVPPYPVACNGQAYVTKFNISGSALVYSTYLGSTGATFTNGGIGRTQAFGIALDSSGNAYLTGSTDAADFPTVNPIQAARSFPYEAFVTEFNASGTGLLFSTYLGGSGSDYGTAIALDSASNLYVTGSTDSSDFPTTPGAYQTSGGGDFVAKIAFGEASTVSLSPDRLAFAPQDLNTTSTPLTRSR